MRGTGSYEGVEAIRGLWEEYYGNFGIGIEIEELLSFGKGVVLAVLQQRGRPLGSTGDLRAQEAFVYEWAEGVVVRVTMHRDIDEAHAAAERIAESGG